MESWDSSILLDDTIIFCSGKEVQWSNNAGAKRVCKYFRLNDLINIWGAFYFHEKTPLIVEIKLRRLAGIRQKTFPFQYLGCPIFYERSIYGYFEDLIMKVGIIIFSWHNKFLSFGGKQVLVNHILQSMPIYLLSTMNPTKNVMVQIRQNFVNFFWGNVGGAKGKH